MCNTLLFQLHTTDLDDGFDWNRLNLKSVTEENSLDEFLSTAEMAGTEFSAGNLEPIVIYPFISQVDMDNSLSLMQSHKKDLNLVRSVVVQSNQAGRQ